MGVWKDHKGVYYTTCKEMAAAWGLTSSLVNARLNRGLTIEETLTLPRKKGGGRYLIKDHNGKAFINKRALCDHYGISVSTYNSRKKSKWPLKEILTRPARITPRRYRLEPIDHEGHKFKSVSDMCNFYQIPISTFYHRIDSNWGLEKSLMTKVRRK